MPVGLWEGKKTEEKKLRGRLERLVRVVPCGARVRFCPLDFLPVPLGGHPSSH